MAHDPVAERLDPWRSIESYLAEWIPHLAQRASARGRPEVVPAGLLWGAMLVCMLRGTPSQRAVWRQATGVGLWDYAPVMVTSEAVRKRLVRQGPAAMEAVMRQATERLLAQGLGDATLAPFATEVYALDASTLDKVRKTLPNADGSPVRPLAGRLHTRFDLRRQLFVDVHLTESPVSNERTIAPDLITNTPEGSLLLMDRGYVKFQLFDAIAASGRFFLTRYDKTFTSTWTLIDAAGVRDELGFAGVYRADRGEHLLRRITITHPDGNQRCYLTNVRDPHLLPPVEVARLYARRWDIEMAFNQIKRTLHLHLIWSTSWPMIQLQVWATLLIFQIASAFRLLLAIRAKVDLFDVSFSLLLQDLPHYVARGIVDVIGTIAARGTAGGIIRPSRRVPIRLPTNLPITLPPHDLPTRRVPRYAGKP